ncbi:MAG: DUF4132 domain-containing protein [Alphaproteobacteria bacterium]|nr:DUF4132 domain-containing protein [Alphaproteobacteria bacterium]
MPGGKLSSKDRNRIETDLKRLNQVQSGMGDRAVEYVTTGQPSAVLLELQQAGDAAADKLHFHRHALQVEERNTVTYRWLYMHHGEFDPDIWWRYGEVLAAADPADFMLSMYAPGTKDTPLALRSILLEWVQATQTHLPGVDKVIKGGRPLSIGMIRALAKAGGGDDGNVAQSVFGASVSYYTNQLTEKLCRADDFIAFMTEASTDVVKALRAFPAQSRAEVIEVIAKRGLLEQAAYEAFAVEQAFGGAKTVRQRAQSQLLNIARERLVAICEERLGQGNASERAEAAAFLNKAAPEDAMKILKAHKKTEKSSKVIEAIDACLASAVALQSDDQADESGDSAGYLALDGTHVAIPAMAELPEPEPLPDDLESRVEEAVRFHDKSARAHNEKLKGKPHNYKIPEHSSNGVKAILKLLRNPGSRPSNGMQTLSHVASVNRAEAGSVVAKILRDLGIARQCQLLASTETAHYTLTPLNITLNTNYWGANVSPCLNDWMLQGGDFRIIAHLVANAGGSKYTTSADEFVAENWNRPELESLPADGLWPYFAENLDAVDRVLGLKPWVAQRTHHQPSTARAFDLLELLPKTPQRYLPQLLEFATSSGVRYRQRARNLLQAASGIDEHIVKLFQSKKQEVRAGAFEWATQRDMKQAIKAIHKALKKEKAERPRAAAITALRDLGEDVSAYLSEKKLKAEAEAGLAKVKPKNLDWFPYSAMPSLRFKSNKPVPSDVVKWWIVSANKLKQPRGNGLFDLYLGELAEGDAEKLGLFLIDAFVSHDTQMRSEAEANAYAEANADQYYQAYKRWDESMTREKAFAILKAGKAGEYLGSAAANQGILGLATQAAPADAAQRVRSYLKAHGARVAQSKSLLQMLSSNPAPAAIQVILSVSERHKQKSVMTLAKELINEIAERRGWTPDQLADRTTPKCGLDDHGVMELEYGSPDKIYTVRFDGVDKLVITGPSGKTVKSLPSVKSDNEEVMAEVKASKAALSAARKELKQVATLQRRRLYEAMCAGRRWELSEWDQHIRSHPVVGRFAQQLIWLAGRCDEADGDGADWVSFRPMEDGSLTDHEDGEVSLQDCDFIELCHSAKISEAGQEAWKAHLADYEITPLFGQLDRPLLKIDKDKADATEIGDRKGWLMEFLSMRGRASKLGYDAGSPEDGGFYHTWEKTFPSSGLVAIIEFTGAVAGMGSENEAAALKTLSFRRGKSHRSLKLSDVPPVLVSECWSDYHRIADGGAFDPLWEKKASWT